MINLNNITVRNNMFNELYKDCIEVPQKELLVKRFNNHYFDHNYKGTKFNVNDITIKGSELFLNMNNLKNDNFGYSGIAVYNFPLHKDYLESTRHI